MMKTESPEVPRCRVNPKMPCDETCIYKRILAVMGKKHTLDVIRILMYEKKARFKVLQNEIKGSSKTLTDRLTELCSYGIIKREAFAEIPPRVEYSLTEKGLALTPVMDALKDWTEQWIKK
ncbi:MAG: winged helix-turn-helix transcriptional regulator [Candidatus Thorarchaeota archaeon]